MKTKKSFLTILCALCLCLPCLFLTACDKNEHEHEYSEGWSSSSSEHWHACIDENCNETKDRNTHTASDWIVDTNATCTTPGSRHKECLVCKYVMATETIPAGHTLEHHEAVAATCTTAGNVEYWTCTVCNKNFDAETNGTELTTVTIPATGKHNYVDGVCSMCDDIEAGKVALVETNNVKKAYDNFITAINEANDGSTVTLLQDLEVENVYIDIDKDLIIDFGGHNFYLKSNNNKKSITVGGIKQNVNLTLRNGYYKSIYHLLYITNKANVTIASDMTLIGAQMGPVAGINLVDGSTLNLYGTLTYEGKYSNLTGITTYVNDDDNNPMDANATINIYSSAIIHSVNHGIVAVDGTKVNVYGTIISEKQAAITGNGNTGMGNIKINVYDGANLESKTNVAIYMPNSGSLNISGGNIKGTTAIYVKSGDVTISGGIMLATLETYTDYKYNNDGCNATGDAIIIDACGYPGGNPTVAISGGYFVVTDTTNAHKIGYYKYNNNEATLNIDSIYTQDLFTKEVSA